jgi:hypothetical protein
MNGGYCLTDEDKDKGWAANGKCRLQIKKEARTIHAGTDKIARIQGQSWQENVHCAKDRTRVVGSVG